MGTSISEQKTDLSADIVDALMDYLKSDQPISKDFVGKMDQKEVTLPVGEPMSLEGESWALAKLYETTKGPILFSLAVLLLMLGIFAGSFFEQRNGRTLMLDGKQYDIVGLAKVNDAKGDVYFPVYKENAK